MSQGLGQSREYVMAVGSSTMLEPTLMEGETIYTSMETTASNHNWSSDKADVNALCRLCAGPNDYLIPIYDGQGLEFKLEFKIQKYLPVQVSQTDTLPLVVCYQCASTIIAYDTIVTNCLEAEKKLRSLAAEAAAAASTETILPIVEDVGEVKPDEEVDEPLSFEEAQVDDLDSDDEPLIASKTRLMSEKTKSTPIKKKILSKAKKVTTRSDKTVEGKEDSGKERSARPVGYRVLKSNPKWPKEMEAIAILNPSGALKRMYRCLLCGHSAHRSSNLKQHLFIHKRVLSYYCVKCGKTCEKRTDSKDWLLFVEITYSHARKKEFKCTLCGHLSNRSNNMKKHLLCHEVAQRVTCGICGNVCRASHVKKYDIKEVEILTIVGVNGRKRREFRCLLCGTMLHRRSQMLSHLSSHKPVVFSSCNSCGAEFTGSKGLREHVKTAHPPISQSEPSRSTSSTTRIFNEAVCHYCGDVFPSQDELHFHSKVHMIDLDEQ